jgi:hypothetical protein
MGEVVAFPGVTLEQRKREADGDIVALLERYLAYARAGELECCIIAAVRDGTANGAWEPTLDNGRATTLAMGAAHYMAHRLMKGAIEEDCASDDEDEPDPPSA